MRKVLVTVIVDKNLLKINNDEEERHNNSVLISIENNIVTKLNLNVAITIFADLKS